MSTSITSGMTPVPASTQTSSLTGPLNPTTADETATTQQIISDGQSQSGSASELSRYYRKTCQDPNRMKRVLGKRFEIIKDFNSRAIRNGSTGNKTATIDTTNNATPTSHNEPGESVGTTQTKGSETPQQAPQEALKMEVSDENASHNPSKQDAAAKTEMTGQDATTATDENIAPEKKTSLEERSQEEPQKTLQELSEDSILQTLQESPRELFQEVQTAQPNANKKPSATDADSTPTDTPSKTHPASSTSKNRSSTPQTKSTDRTAQPNKSTKGSTASSGMVQLVKNFFNSCLSCLTLKFLDSHKKRHIKK